MPLDDCWSDASRSGPGPPGRGARSAGAGGTLWPSTPAARDRPGLERHHGHRSDAPTPTVTDEAPSPPTARPRTRPSATHRRGARRGRSCWSRRSRSTACAVSTDRGPTAPDLMRPGGGPVVARDAVYRLAPERVAAPRAVRGARLQLRHAQAVVPEAPRPGLGRRVARRHARPCSEAFDAGRGRPAVAMAERSCRRSRTLETSEMIRHVDDPAA